LPAVTAAAAWTAGGRLPQKTMFRQIKISRIGVYEELPAGPVVFYLQLSPEDKATPRLEFLYHLQISNSQ